MPIKPYYTIPLPTAIPYGRGIEATDGPNGCQIITRATKPEREKVRAAAAKIGLSYSAFIRRTINDMADAILKEDDVQP